MSNKIKSLEREINLLKSQIEALNSSTNSLDSAEAENKELKSKLLAAESELGSKIEEITLLQAKNDENEKEVVRLTEISNANDQALHVARKEVETLQAAKDTLESEHKEYLSLNEELTVENGDLKHQLEQLQESPSDEEEEVVEPTIEEIKETVPEFDEKEKDISKYVKACFDHYGVDLGKFDYKQNSSNNKFYNLVIDGKKINAKITNGNFMVKGGGGWYSLSEYIYEFFIKKKASKKSHSTRKSLLTTEVGDKSNKKVREKNTIDLHSSFTSSSSKNSSLKKSSPTKKGTPTKK